MQKPPSTPSSFLQRYYSLSSSLYIYLPRYISYINQPKQNPHTIAHIIVLCVRDCLHLKFGLVSPDLIVVECDLCAQFNSSSRFFSILSRVGVCRISAFPNSLNFVPSFDLRGSDLGEILRGAMKMELNGGISRKSKLKRLKCSVQNYGWGRIGSDTAVARMYAANSGALIDSSRPYAEFWMGTHESGPSFVVKNKKNAVLANGYRNGCLKPRRSGPFDQDVIKANGYLNGNGRIHSRESAPSDNIVPVRIVNGNGHCDLKGETLKSWIEKNPSVLGDKVLERWGSDLPFLFKVLSIAKPLSIQAHPDKVLARELNKLHPNLYKDDNHKPEMALALTEFEALCGFLEIKELKDVLRTTPEIEDLVGNVNRAKVLNVDDNDEENIKAMVKLLFTEIMSASKNIVAEVLSKLKSRLYLVGKEKLTPKEQLVLRLEEEYPDDVGVIAAFFMNYVKLKPGEALYLDANELHAYVSGDCIECMATSDNVVRAGLTPKKRDVETLCSMLTYNLGFPHTLKGTTINKYTKRYRPPFEEFEVDLCDIPEGASVSFSAIPGPSIFVIVEGNGVIRTHDHGEETAVVGDVLFTPANVEVSVKAYRHLKLYRAGVNSEFL